MSETPRPAGWAVRLRPTLRARIVLIVLASFATLAAGLVLEGQVRQRAAERRYDAAVLAGDRNGWRGLTALVAGQLRDELLQLTAREDVVQALARRDRAGLAIAAASAPATGRVVREAERSTLLRPDLEILASDGQVLHTTRRGRGTFPAAEAALLMRVATGQRPELLGLLRTVDGDYLVAAAAPVYTRAGPAGLAILSVQAGAVLPALEAALGASAALVAPDGAVVRPRRAGLLPPETTAGLGAGTPDHAGPVRDATGRVHHRAVIAATDLFGRHAATLVTVRDVTEATRRDALISGLSYGALAAFALLLIGFLQFYLRRAFRPLGAVVRVLDALAQGRRDVAFEAPPAASSDEIGRLALAVQAFRANLAALEEARAARERIEGELAIAREIQLKMVPNAFPAFVERSDFRLHAILEPAKAVGGDLYDFFLVGDRRLFFLVGDVSDKGVAAALFMATVRTLFRVTAQATGLPLVQVVETVNRFLVENNPSTMFVTVFAGILDTVSGEVEYCDGGHEPPFIRRGDGAIELLAKVGGLALGVVDDFRYRSARLRMTPGDTLVLYTDGVSEAANPEDAMFTAGRIGKLLAGLPADVAPEAVTAALLEAVQAFAGSAPQSDDIAVLAIQVAAADGGDRGAGRARLSLATRSVTAVREVQ